ncbi:MAG TPA: DUF4112 domain-containing protein [Polyangiaceae bacterium]|nr:DUF4112 domain-containing protein [Polyangiaceae bacterium]
MKDLKDFEPQGQLERAGNAAAAARELPIPEWARRLAGLLDSAIRIPGTDIRIGLDPILGALLPELGDALTAVLSLTLLVVAFSERVPTAVLLRMLLNIALDAVLGAIPVVGDVFDFAFKANEKNLALIERHRGDASRKATLGDYAVIGGALAFALALVLLPILVGIALFRFWGAITHD